MSVAGDDVSVPGRDQRRRGALVPLSQPAVNRCGGELHQGAGRDERRKSSGSELHFGITLRVREHGREAAAPERPDLGLERKWPAEIRKLDEQIARVASEAETAQLAIAQSQQARDRDLRSAEHAQTDALHTQDSIELEDQTLHGLDRSRVIVAHVRGCRHDRDTVASRGQRDLHALLERSSAIVEPGEDV